MISGWKSYANNEPEFEATIDLTIAKFYLPSETSGKTSGETVGKTVGKTVEKILILIKNNPKITGRELERETGLTRRGVEYNIDKLKKSGILKRIGPAKGGHWEILSGTEKWNTRPHA